MSQAPIEQQLHRAVQSNRLVLLAGTVGLLAVLAFVAATTDGTTRDTVGLLGLAGVVAGLGTVTLDAWVRLPRPAPRQGTYRGTGATRLLAAGSAYVAMLLLTAGLTLIAVSFLMAPSLDSVGQGRRGGAWVYVVVVGAPLLLAGAVALLVRRDQVLLAPDWLVVRRVGRERALRWDAVRQVEPVAGNPGLVLRISAADGSALLVATRPLTLGPDELAAVVRHLAATPGDRSRLGTAAAVPMIEKLGRGGRS